MKRPIDILRRLPKFSGFLVKKPRFALHAANTMTRMRFGQKLITAVEYAVTYNCQAHCEKCSAKKMHDPSRQRLTDEQIKQVADDVYRLGAYEINLTGGEPLLEKRLEDIITYFHPSSSFIGINTNGALLDRPRILSLKEAGADLFKISIDSPVAAEHDASRGIDGLYEHIFEMLRVIDEISGVRGHLCMVTTREQIEAGKVSQAVELAKQYNASFGFVFPSVAGGWSRQHEVLIEAHHREQLAQWANDPAVFLQGNLGKGDFLCPCGTSEIYVTCYGDVIPCPFIQIAFGNVGEEPFPKIYHRMINWKEFKKDSHMCRGAEDMDFIKRYSDPLHDREHLPVRYGNHPNIAADDLPE